MYKSLYNFPTERQRVTYPWRFWDGAFTEEELKKICTYFETQELERSAVVLQQEQEVDESIRISNIKFCNYEPTNSDTLWIFQRMNMVIDAVNNQYYNFDLNGYDFFQYTEYDAHENGKYDYHMDTLMGNTIPKDMIETRKLSVTMCINEPGEEYEGGEFEINQNEIYTLIDLAHVLQGKCNNRVIFFAACKTLSIPKRKIMDFLKTTKALAVCGYNDEVDWMLSTAFELLVLFAFQNNVSDFISRIKRTTESIELHNDHICVLLFSFI